MKKAKEKLTEIIIIRVTKEEKNQLKMLASMYSNGNMSAYMINRSLYSSRKEINSSDFEFSSRRVGKPKKDLPE